MSSQKKYLSFYAIQERLKSHHEQTGQYITLSQAVQMLSQEGRVLSAPMTCPDFSNWDVANPSQLYDLYAQASMEISSILRDPEAYYSFVSEEYLGFSIWDVLPHIKLCCEAITPHTHDFFEINYVLDGSLEMECAAEKKVAGGRGTVYHCAGDKSCGLCVAGQHSGVFLPAAQFLSLHLFQHIEGERPVGRLF